MLKLIKRLAFSFRQPSAETDGKLDEWIREALWEDAAAQPPDEAWDRLCKAVADHKPVKGYGMWILDEPLREPRPSSSMLSERQLRRALRLHDEDRMQTYHFRLKLNQVLWSNVPPTFLAQVNL